jgi:hypothetical protein
MSMTVTSDGLGQRGCGQYGKVSKTVNSCVALRRIGRCSNSGNFATLIDNPPNGPSTLALARFPQKKVLEDELAIACRERRTAISAI